MNDFPLAFLIGNLSHSLGDRAEVERLDRIEMVKQYLIRSVRQSDFPDELDGLLESLPAEIVLAFLDLSFVLTHSLAELFIDEQTRYIPEEIDFEDFDTSKPEWFNAVGIKVIDGDTFKAVVWTNESVTSVREIRVRLLGINAPETHTRNTEEKKRGLDAKYQLGRMIELQSLALYLPGKKSFNRELGWAFYAGRNAKLYGVNLSEEMVRRGCAEWKEY